MHTDMEYLVDTPEHKWGGIINVTGSEELLHGHDRWREQLYQRKMLVIRGLPRMDMETLYDLHQTFGRPWTAEEYKLTTEKYTEVNGKAVTEYGNLITKESIGNRRMPWHRDIPWHRGMRYPIRTLYPVKMTNGAVLTGTDFCDADILWKRLGEKEQWKMLHLTMDIQSWYQYQYKLPKVDQKNIPLVEQHRHSKLPSVLLNSFGPIDSRYEFSVPLSGTWILDSYFEGKRIGLEFINELHRIATTPDNIYTHKWQEGDLVLFDNSSGVFHRRNRIETPADGSVVERLFWRMNLHHYWET